MSYTPMTNYYLVLGFYTSGENGVHLPDRKMWVFLYISV